MRQRLYPRLLLLSGFLILMLPLLSAWAADAPAGVTNFQIVWVNVGEVATASGDVPTRVGKHLFKAPDLVRLSMQEIQVERIDTEPAIRESVIGQRVCLSSFDVRALNVEGELLPAVPLSIALRQDHKAALNLERRDDDVCVRPTQAGEYPMRLTSLLPASDGTTRGAQIFLRVAEKGAAAAPAGDSPAVSRSDMHGQHLRIRALHNSSK